jgi:hypothetical protein
MIFYASHSRGVPTPISLHSCSYKTIKREIIWCTWNVNSSQSYLWPLIKWYIGVELPTSVVMKGIIFCGVKSCIPFRVNKRLSETALCPYRFKSWIKSFTKVKSEWRDVTLNALDATVPSHKTFLSIKPSHRSPALYCQSPSSGRFNYSSTPLGRIIYKHFIYLSSSFLSPFEEWNFSVLAHILHLRYDC